MAFYLGLLVASCLWMGWYGWKVNRDVDRKVKRLEARCKDYWAA